MEPQSSQSNTLCIDVSGIKLGKNQAADMKSVKPKLSNGVLLVNIAPMDSCLCAGIDATVRTSKL